jgi:hypothetical protein
MKINASEKQSSFGIPPEMKKAEEDFRAKAERARLEKEAPIAAEEELAEDAEGETKEFKQKTPIEHLKTLGIDLQEDDFQHLFFQGYVEKNVVIWAGKNGAPNFTATIKTLTGEESDLADELMMESLGERKGANISSAGLDQRRAVAFLAFAVTKLNGKNIPPNPLKLKDGSLDLKGMAELRRDIIKNLSVAHINKLNRLHASMTATIAHVVEDPSQDFL